MFRVMSPCNIRRNDFWKVFEMVRQFFFHICRVQITVTNFHHFLLSVYPPPTPTLRNPFTKHRLHPRWGSTSCVPRSRNCINCVPRVLLHMHQLRPELSTPNMTSCVPRLVRNCISCIERYGCTKCPTIGRFLHSFVVLYFIRNYMHAYRIVEWYRQHSFCIMLLSNV